MPNMYCDSAHKCQENANKYRILQKIIYTLFYLDFYSCIKSWTGTGRSRGIQNGCLKRTVGAVSGDNSSSIPLIISGTLSIF